MVNRIQVNLRLPEDVLQQLREEAEKQKRSVNNLLEVIIDEYLKKQKSEYPHYTPSAPPSGGALRC